MNHNLKSRFNGTKSNIMDKITRRTDRNLACECDRPAVWKTKCYPNSIVYNTKNIPSCSPIITYNIILFYGKAPVSKYTTNPFLGVPLDNYYKIKDKKEESVSTQYSVSSIILFANSFVPQGWSSALNDIDLGTIDFFTVQFPTITEPKFVHTQIVPKNGKSYSQFVEMPNGYVYMAKFPPATIISQYSKNRLLTVQPFANDRFNPDIEIHMLVKERGVGGSFKSIQKMAVPWGRIITTDITTDSQEVVHMVWTDYLGPGRGENPVIKYTTNFGKTNVDLQVSKPNLNMYHITIDILDNGDMYIFYCQGNENTQLSSLNVFDVSTNYFYKPKGGEWSLTKPVLTKKNNLYVMRSYVYKNKIFLLGREMRKTKTNKKYSNLVFIDFISKQLTYIENGNPSPDIVKQPLSYDILIYSNRVYITYTMLITNDNNSTEFEQILYNISKGEKQILNRGEYSNNVKDGNIGGLYTSINLLSQ